MSSKRCADLTSLYCFHYCLCVLSVAILTVLAAKVSSVWFVDPIGAIVISVWIVSRWAEMTWEQTAKIVGRSGEHKHDLLSILIC
jgi:divalent metal cation (Fe/Co/Zn/Cd) transporter